MTKVLQKSKTPKAIINLILKHQNKNLTGQNRLSETPQTIIDIINHLGTDDQAHTKIAQIFDKGTEIHTTHKIPESVGLLAYLAYDENKATLDEALRLIQLAKRAGIKIQTARSLAHETGIENVLQMLKEKIAVKK